MEQKFENGVTIGDSSNFVKLTRISGPRTEDHMTTVDIAIKAGPFQGAVRDETLVGVSEFISNLSNLYETLRGEAELSSYEKFHLSIKGDGRGAIAARAGLIGHHVPLSKVVFEFGFDQTYLTEIIKGLESEFPSV